ncbi:MAG: TIGR02281 family clan AA aspartic protease [Planctomycetota bacterium]
MQRIFSPSTIAFSRFRPLDSPNVARNHKGSSRLVFVAIRIGLVVSSVMVGCVGLGSTCLGQRAANPIKPTLSDEDKRALADIDDKLKKNFGVLRNNAELKLEGNDESELKVFLAAEPKLKKELGEKEKPKKVMEEEEKLRDQVVQNNLQAIQQINQQLAQGLPVQQHNALVAQNNALVAQNAQIQNSQKQFDEKLKKTRSLFYKAQEKYRGKILDARKKADAIEERWTELEEDKEFMELVKEASGVLKKKELKPATFQAVQRNLAKLEQDFLSDVVELRDAGADTLCVSVTINGEETVEMMIDTGASSISLPKATADALGVKVPSGAPDVVLSLADDSKIMAKQVFIPLVRIGAFEVENVEAVVLNSAGEDAVPLLGMSFLNNNGIKLDIDSKTLTTSKVFFGKKKK